MLVERECTIPSTGLIPLLSASSSDIIAVCACRWFGEEAMGEEGKKGYEQSCKDAEIEFEKWSYTELMLGTREKRESMSRCGADCSFSARGQVWADCRGLWIPLVPPDRSHGGRLDPRYCCRSLCAGTCSLLDRNSCFVSRHRRRSSLLALPRSFGLGIV